MHEIIDWNAPFLSHGGGAGQGNGVVGHIGVGIILSAICLPLTLFQVEVHVEVSVEVQLMVQNIRIP